MACEVMAVQEPQMQLPGTVQLPMDMTAMTAMAQPYVVAMLVPAAMMMPQNQVQVQPNPPSPAAPLAPLAGASPEGFGGSPWNQEMWQAQQPMFYGDYNAYDRKMTTRRNRKTRTQPKVPGMIASRGEELLPMDVESCAKLRERLELLGDQEQASLVVHQEVLGFVWPFSRDPAGCRLVQAAIQTTKPSVGKAIALELQGHVKEATESPHANYVLQKVIEHLSSATSAFIADELLPTVPRFARHRFGCRIVCRLVEHCSNEESTLRLVEKLLEDPEEAIDLCRHNFGHHVVQSILEHGSSRHKEMIAEVLKSDLLNNSSHRSSSYVVEAALMHCSSEDQKSLVQYLVQPAVISELARADFGSYVVRSLLKHPNVDAQVLLQTNPSVAALLSESAQ